VHIVHIALGGCLRAPPVRYGITPDTGGHIAYVLNAALSQALLPETSHVTIVTRRFRNEYLGLIHDQEVEHLSDKITILRIGEAGAPYCEKDALSACLPALAESLRRHMARPDCRFDIAHVHFADAASIGLSLAALTNLPVIYTPHALGIDKLQAGGADCKALRDRIACETNAIQHSDGLIVSTRNEADFQVPRYGVTSATAKTRVIAPGVPPLSKAGAEQGARFLHGMLASPERPLLLAIARPVEKKNLVSLAQLYAQDKELRKRANLVILSGQHALLHPGSEEARVVADLEAIRSDNDLSKHFALPSSHDADDVAGLYRLAAMNGGVFVNPAHHEPFGLTLLEAASAGLPVVATNQGGPVDILARFGHGLLVSPGSREALGGALHRILSRPELRERLAAAAAGATTLLGWESYARASIQFYRSAIAARLRSPRSTRTTLRDIVSLLPPPGHEGMTASGASL